MHVDLPLFLAASPFGWEDLRSILPSLILFLTGAVVLAIDILPGRPERGVLHFISLLGTAVAGAVVCASLASGGPAPRTYFLDAVVTDRFSSAMSLLIILGTAFSLLGAADALRRRGLEHGEFHCLILMASGSMVLFTQSASLILAFLSLETLSMAVYVLTAFARSEKRAVEGALKYFILGGLSSGFLLLGLAFIFGATRSTNLAEIAAILKSDAGRIDPSLLLAGLALTVVGLGFKIGAFPFHFWVPDAYEAAPAVVTGFMAVTVKVASFAVLLRIALLFGGPIGPAGGSALPAGEALSAALSALAVLTMVFGNVVALVQTSVKRMLAYSAIAHTGYLLVGVVAAMGPGRNDGAGDGGGAVLFYLFPYALMSLGAFACVSHLGRGASDLEEMASYRGLSRRSPLLALALLVLMISFVGIPPTSGFWGKLYLFRSALDSGHWGLAITGIITSVISAYYYLGLVVAMYMQPDETLEPPEAESHASGKLAILLSVSAVVLVGFFPDAFFRLSAGCGLP